MKIAGYRGKISKYKKKITRNGEGEDDDRRTERKREGERREKVLAQ